MVSLKRTQYILPNANFWNKRPINLMGWFGEYLYIVFPFLYFWENELLLHLLPVSITSSFHIIVFIEYMQVLWFLFVIQKLSFAYLLYSHHFLCGKSVVSKCWDLKLYLYKNFRFSSISLWVSNHNGIVMIFYYTML